MSGHAYGFSQFNLTFYFLLAILSLKMARKHKLRNNRKAGHEVQGQVASLGARFISTVG